MKTTIEAVYTAVAGFELDFNINEVHSYYIKWNVLHVQFEKDGGWEEFEPDYSSVEDMDLKRPAEVIVEVEETNGCFAGIYDDYI